MVLEIFTIKSIKNPEIRENYLAGKYNYIIVDMDDEGHFWPEIFPSIIQLIVDGHEKNTNTTFKLMNSERKISNTSYLGVYTLISYIISLMNGNHDYNETHEIKTNPYSTKQMFYEDLNKLGIKYDIKKMLDMEEDENTIEYIIID